MIRKIELYMNHTILFKQPFQDTPVYLEVLNLEPRNFYSISLRMLQTLKYNLIILKHFY